MKHKLTYLFVTIDFLHYLERLGENRTYPTGIPRGQRINSSGSILSGRQPETSKTQIAVDLAARWPLRNIQKPPIDDSKLRTPRETTDKTSHSLCRTRKYQYRVYLADFSVLPCGGSRGLLCLSRPPDARVEMNKWIGRDRGAEQMSRWLFPSRFIWIHGDSIFSSSDFFTRLVWLTCQCSVVRNVRRAFGYKQGERFLFLLTFLCCVFLWISGLDVCISLWNCWCWFTKPVDSHCNYSKCRKLLDRFTVTVKHELYESELFACSLHGLLIRDTA